jgi:hypothetical protein
MFVQRNTEFICALKHNVQKLIFPGPEAVAAMRVELGMEILIWICRRETHEAWTVLDGQVLAGTVPKSQIVVCWALESVDNERWYSLLLLGRLVTDISKLVPVIVFNMLVEQPCRGGKEKEKSGSKDRQYPCG